MRKPALAPVKMYQASLCFIEPIGLYRLITDYMGRKRPLQEHLFTKKTFSSILEKNQLFLSPSNFPHIPCSCSPVKQYINSDLPQKKSSQPKITLLLAGVQHIGTGFYTNEDVSTWPHALVLLDSQVIETKINVFGNKRF